MVIQVHRLQLSAGKTDDGAELCWAGRSRVGVGVGVVKLTRMAVGTPAIAAVTAVVVFALIAVTPF
jgi:hypothetical protein